MAKDSILSMVSDQIEILFLLSVLFLFLSLCVCFRATEYRYKRQASTTREMHSQTLAYARFFCFHQASKLCVCKIARFPLRLFPLDNVYDNDMKLYLWYY